MNEYLDRIGAFRINIISLYSKIIITSLFLFAHFNEASKVAFFFSLVSLIYYNKNNLINSYGKILKNYFIYMFIIFLLSILLNLQYYKFVEENYSYIVDSQVNYLYFKIAINGLIWIIISFWAYWYGLLIAKDKIMQDSTFKFLILLGVINALYNIITWYITTGGIIERYNFISPIFKTPSGGITLSILCFFLAIEYFKKYKYQQIIILAIFLFNAIIIVTRASQLIFVTFIILYLCSSFIKNKRGRNKIILIAIGIFLLLILFYPNIQNTYSKYYTTIFVQNSDDNIIRSISIESAIKIFKQNPYFGIGYGMYGAHNNIIYKGVTLGSPHNGFYSILSEWGIVGVVLTIYLFIHISFAIIELLSRKKESIDLIMSMFLAGNMFMFFIGNYAYFPPPSETAYYLNGIILWMFVGMLYYRKNIGLVNNK